MTNNKVQWLVLAVGVLTRIPTILVRSGMWGYDVRDVSKLVRGIKMTHTEEGGSNWF